MLYYVKKIKGHKRKQICFETIRRKKACTSTRKMDGPQSHFTHCRYKSKAGSHLEPDELLNVVREVRGEVCQQLAQPRLLVQDRQETQLGTVRPYIEKLFNNHLI